MQPAVPMGLPTEAHVSEMINKAFDILYVLNDLKDEASRRGPVCISNSAYKINLESLFYVINKTF